MWKFLFYFYCMTELNNKLTENTLKNDQKQTNFGQIRQQHVRLAKQLADNAHIDISCETFNSLSI